MKEGPREQQLRELREARARKPNPFEDAARGRDPVQGAEPAASRTVHGGEAVGRTVGSNPATGAKPKLGRPRKPDAELSRASKYRRKAEEKGNDGK